MVTIDTKAWHYKIVRFILAAEFDMPRDLCTYWWLVIFSPVFGILYGIAWLIFYPVTAIVFCFHLVWKGVTQVGLMTEIIESWKSLYDNLEKRPIVVQLMVIFSPVVFLFGLAGMYIPALAATFYLLLFCWLAMPFASLVSIAKRNVEKRLLPSKSWQHKQRVIGSYQPTPTVPLFKLWIGSFKQKHCKLVQYQ